MKRSLFAVLSLSKGVLFLLASLVLVACASPQAAPVLGKAVPADGGTYFDLTASQLEVMLKTKDFPLVNVHIPYEGEIANTDLSIPYNQIENRLAALPPDKGAKIVLYCRSGSMSAIAARTLVRLGYTNVWNLAGGMVGWQQQGYPLLGR